MQILRCAPFSWVKSATHRKQETCEDTKAVRTHVWEYSDLCNDGRERQSGCPEGDKKRSLIVDHAAAIPPGPAGIPQAGSRSLFPTPFCLSPNLTPRHSP